MVSEKKEGGGAFPEWEQKKLGEVASIIMGQSPNSSNYNMAKIGLPLIQGNADCKNRKTQPKTFTSQITKKCDISDIIMSVRAPVGSISMSLHNACIGRGVCSIKHNNKKLQAFLYQMLVHSERLWSSISQGSTFESVNRNDIYTFSLNMPKSIKEQQKIAQVLSDIDDLIYKTEEIIDKHKSIKHSAMQKIFSQELRFKQDNGSDFPEWEEKKLGDVGEIITGKTPSTTNKSLWNGNIQFVTPTDISERKYQNETIRNVTNISNLKVLPIGSIMFTCIASIGKMAISCKPCITNQQINSIIVDNKNNNEYIYYAISSISEFIKSKTSSTTLPIINKTEFSKFTIQIPSLPEQQKIATFLSSLDDQITQQTSYLQKLKNQKQALMQALLSGKIRLK